MYKTSENSAPKGLLKGIKESREWTKCNQITEETSRKKYWKRTFNILSWKSTTRSVWGWDIGRRIVHKQYMPWQSRKSTSKKHSGKVERGKQNIIVGYYTNTEEAKECHLKLINQSVRH